MWRRYAIPCRQEGGFIEDRRTLVSAGFGIALIGWISFVPAALQEQFAVPLWIVLGVGLLWIAFTRGSGRFLLRMGHLPLWGLLFAWLVSVVPALDRTLAWHSWRAMAIPLAGFYLVFYGLCAQSEVKRRLALALALCGAAIAFMAIIEWCVGSNIIYERWVGNVFYERYMTTREIPFRRALSTQSHPTVLGSFLVGCLPFGLQLAADRRRVRRVIGVVSVGLHAIAIILTFSRGAFFAMMCVLGLYGWFRGRRRVVLGLMVLLVAVVGGLHGTGRGDGPVEGIDRLGFTRFIYGSVDSVISPYRINRVVASFRGVALSPWIGIGLDHFRERFHELFPGPRPTQEAHLIADNMYLTLLTETGVVGFGCWSLFIGVLLVRGGTALRRAPPGEARDDVLIPMIAFIGLLVSMLGYDLFYWPNPLALFSMLGGMLAAACVLAARERRRHA